MLFTWLLRCMWGALTSVNNTSDFDNEDLVELRGWMIRNREVCPNQHNIKITRQLNYVESIIVYYVDISMIITRFNIDYLVLLLLISRKVRNEFAYI